MWSRNLAEKQKCTEELNRQSDQIWQVKALKWKQIDYFGIFFKLKLLAHTFSAYYILATLAKNWLLRMY